MSMRGLLALALLNAWPAWGQDMPAFVAHDPELFAAPQGQSQAWADYDADGDLDLIVLFRREPVRLYQNTGGDFTDVAADVGLHVQLGNMRAVAWGDYDNDGDLDVYLGYSDRRDHPNKLMRNDGGLFTDVAPELGVDLEGITGQVSFIDYDGDGDLDLFVAFREIFNRLFQNQGDGTFQDVSFPSGIADIRRTVGACWFDYDGDGDLDLFDANQNGDRDGFYRNDEGRFTDVGIELNIDQPRRPTNKGSVGCAVADYDTDGDLDLYVAEYGSDSLWRNDGGSFTDVAAQLGVDTADHMVTGAFADVNHDGRPDLYTVGYRNRQPGTKDFFYLNEGDRFVDALPATIAADDADHGIQFADFDGDGDLDLHVTANDPAGAHQLFRNDFGGDRTSLRVMVLDHKGHFTRAGSEVRVFRAGTRDLLGLRMVDTGGGYKSQNAMPVHVAVPGGGAVDVEVSTFLGGKKSVTRIDGVDPADHAGGWLTVRTTDP